MKHSLVAMTALERRAVFALASVFAVRMLGLFLILPVFALYAQNLPDYTPLMVGLAIGAYGLTQALLQIPFGLLSDRIGRKPVIIGGLLIYAVGSVIAASAGSLHAIIPSVGILYWVILGRIIQGGGAIAAAIMALTADLTSEEVRLRAMAVIGMTIGATFMISVLLGPVLDHWVGVPGIFWITSVLALCAIAVTIFLVPQPIHSTIHRDAETVPAQLGLVLRNPNLLRANFGIFTLQMLLTSIFLVIPLELQALNVPRAQHWHLYLPVMLASALGIVPLILLSERGNSMKWVALSGILTLSIAELALFAWGGSIVGLAGALFMYFLAFNFLEAFLPSLVARLAPAAAKGTAMGVFATCQFFGAFCGGLFGGIAHETLGLQAVFIFGAGVALLWLLVASGMSNPPRLANKLIRLGVINQSQAEQLSATLLAIPGVLEAVVIVEEELAYLKIDQSVFDPNACEKILQTTNSSNG